MAARRNRLRSRMTTVGEIVGALLMAIGVGTASIPAGMVVGGMLLMGLCMLAGDE